MVTMKNRIYKYMILLGAIIIFPSAALSATIEKVVASVDGEAITLLELDEAMDLYGPEIQKKEGVSGATLRVRVLNRLIDEKVMETALRSTKITVEPHEVDTFINRILKSSHITEEIFRQKLLEKGLTYEQYRQNVEKEILRNKFVNEHVGRKITVSERELKDYFNKNMDEFKSSSSVRLAQLSILFTPQTTQEDLKNVEDLTMKIYHAAQSTSNFAALGKTFSTSRIKVEGEDMGVVQLTDLQPQFAQHAGMLEVGQVSQPIVTNMGIHFIKVLDRAKTSAKDFNSVRDQVQNVVYDIKVQKALKGYVKKLRKYANISIKGI